MTTFVIFAVLFVLAALALVIPPFFKGTGVDKPADRRDLNIAMYRERLAELQRDSLSQAEFERAKQELDKTLVQEVDTTPNAAPATMARWTGIVVAIVLPALAAGMYWRLGSPNLINPPEIPQTADGAPDIEQMLARVEQRLAENPTDTKGWQILARSYRSLERYPEAVKAYARLVELTAEKDAEALAGLAEMMALQADGDLAGKPAELLQKALQAEPQEPNALWLTGMAAMQQKNYAQAIEYWQRLQALLPPEGEDRQTLDSHLAEARQLAGLPAVTPPAAVASQPEAAAPAAASAAKLDVKAALAPELQAQIKPEYTLFVYARAAQGPRMPLAIVKKTAADLPLSVTLDDSLSMSPAMKLSNVAEVIVTARISPSGSAMAQAGDWIGESAPLHWAKQGQVEVKIDRAVP
jgi:cytochrome c-type biogenesis protein CcmH